MFCASLFTLVVISFFSIRGAVMVVAVRPETDSAGLSGATVGHMTHAINTSSFLEIHLFLFFFVLSTKHRMVYPFFRLCGPILL